MVLRHLQRCGCVGIATSPRSPSIDARRPPLRRRYQSGLRNFFNLDRSLTTTWQMYDNSTHEPRLIALRARTGTVPVNDAVLWGRILADAPAGGPTHGA